MRIASLKLAGFRGVKNELTLEFPAGFVVIVGRNGTGKSTICDAIEYALLQTIRGESDHVEKGEGIGDYIWWRGADGPSRRYVELGLVDADNNHYTITRTPTETSCTKGFDLERSLCHPDSGIQHPLRQLCRTAILRAEDITRLSVDLKETDRFDFVRSALGTADFSSAETKAKQVTDLLSREVERANTAYSAVSGRVTDATSRLSHARTEIAKASETTTAESTLRRFVEDATSASDAIMLASERRLADLRVRVDRTVRLYGKIQDHLKERLRIQSPSYVEELASVGVQLERAKTTLLEAEQRATAIGELIAKEELESPRTASLALLREHGSRVGLVDGHCPVCGGNRSESDYRAHLQAVARTVSESNDRLTLLTKQAAELAGQVAALKAEATRLSSKHTTLRGQETQLLEEQANITEEARKLDIDVGQMSDADIDRIAKTIQSGRARISEIEQALSIMQASRAVERVTSLEQELKTTREEVFQTEQRLSRLRKALARAKEASGTIRRVQGEFVNEQLAQLEPLMMELYQRLRPHVDWPEVRYRLRGDVRRMLSLEIGDGLNPSFVFSSGQRRAVGLAFLLALHLSRSWCTFNTLILDDPVQHIDDYRALHLTEVLAAVRGLDRQIICTVEDESLGQLLSRRLRSDAGTTGSLVSMAYSSRQGVYAQSVRPVAPMPATLLVPA